MATVSLGLKALLIFTLSFAKVHLSASKSTVKGVVSCLDCSPHHELSGILVGIMCNHDRRLVTTTTKGNGFFEAEIAPSSSSSTTNCIAKLLGGSEKLCSFKTSMVSKVVKAHGLEEYKLSTPLTLLSTCPSQNAHQGQENEASKTVDLPLPREWGLAPSSYYITPYIPIIGIP